MRTLRLATVLTALLVSLTALTGCGSVSVDELKSSDRKIVLLDRGIAGDSWAYENSLGWRTPLERCSMLTPFENCFKLPNSNLELRYPLMGGSVERDAKISGLALGERFGCRELSSPWGPKAICAVL